MKIKYLHVSACFRLFVLLCSFGFPALLYAISQEGIIAHEDTLGPMDISVSLGKSRVEPDEPVPVQSRLESDSPPPRLESDSPPPRLESDSPPLPPGSSFSMTITGGNFIQGTITPQGLFPQGQPLPSHFHSNFDSNGVSGSSNGPDMSDIGNRINSVDAERFKHSPYILAQCGFFDKGVGDTVECFSCKQEFSAWWDNDHVLKRHYDRSPECRHVQHLCQNPSPVNVSFKKCSARAHACTDLPESVFTVGDNNHKTPESFAKAGLYSVGQGDRTKCFYCDGGLENWVSDDDAMDQHIRWFPNCPYVAQLKTSEEIQAVMRQYRGDRYESMYKESIFTGPFIPAFYELRTYSLQKRINSFQETELTPEQIRRLADAGFSLDSTDSQRACCKHCNFSQTIAELLTSDPAELHSLQIDSGSLPCPFVSQTMIITGRTGVAEQTNAVQEGNNLQQAFNTLTAQGYVGVEDQLAQLTPDEYMMTGDQLVSILRSRLSVPTNQHPSPSGTADIADIVRPFLRDFSEERVNNAISDLLDRRALINHAALERELNSRNAVNAGNEGAYNHNAVGSFAGAMEGMTDAFGGMDTGLSHVRNRNNNTHRRIRARTSGRGSFVSVRGVTLMENGQWVMPQAGQFGTGFRGGRVGGERSGDNIDTENLTPVTGVDDPEACQCCYTNKADHVQVPCGHVYACGACVLRAVQNRQCPQCREPVDKIIRMFR